MIRYRTVTKRHVDMADRACNVGAMQTTDQTVTRERVIRRLMAQTNTSEASLALAAGISRTTLRSKLVGDRFMVPELDRIARALGTTASAILAEAEMTAAA